MSLITGDFRIFPNARNFSGRIGEGTAEDSTPIDSIARELRGLSPSGVEWCNYGISPYRGCYHNCIYCYAKLMNQRYGWVKSWSKPEPKEVRWQDLKKSVTRAEPGRIFFSPVCDAYQPLEKKLGLSRRILEEVLLPSQHQIYILTKSSLVGRDFDIVKGRENVRVGLTITTLDDKTAKSFEPNSSPPSERVKTLEEAHSLGIFTFVSIEPWILEITNPVEIMSKLHSTVDAWIIGTHNYSGAQKESYRPLVGPLFQYLSQSGVKYLLKDELLQAIKGEF